ncbi:MAG TPA: hypothetical protein VN521_10335 [Negativicutes bacterium]|nr:hypothetical protein [Negativicutes bacterium]
MSAFRGTRIANSGTAEIVAPPEKVFPLLCPVREKEWLDGWNYEMIHSKSGLAEQGCAFTTDLPPEGRAYWLMTRHEPPHEAEYVRFVPGLMFVTLSLKLTERDGGTTLDITLTHTGVAEKGNAFVAAQAEAQFARIMRRMESALNHFFATGTMLKNP